MTLTARTYTPRADSLAACVIDFFRRADDDEELHLSDIVLKFDAPKESIHALLKDAVTLDILKRNNSLYSAGPQIGAKADCPPAAVGLVTPPIATRKTGYTSNRKHLDFKALQVDDDVPYLPQARRGSCKYDPLFARLTKPGQSTAIPGDTKGALAAAIIKRNKTGPGTFKVAMTGATEARVWRIA